MMLWARNACRGFRKIPKIFFSQRSVHDVVSKEDVQKFKACGAVCLRGIFENEWIEKVERGVQEAVRSPSERSEALEGGPSGATYYNDHNNWRRIREFEDFVFNSPAGEIVGKLMESQVSGWPTLAPCMRSSQFPAGSRIIPANRGICMTVM